MMISDHLPVTYPPVVVVCVVKYATSSDWTRVPSNRQFCAALPVWQRLDLNAFVHAVTCTLYLKINGVQGLRQEGMGVSKHPLSWGLVQFFTFTTLQNTQYDCYQWLSNSSRVHQVRFRSRLRLGPRWGSLQWRERDGKRGEGGKGRGRGGTGKGENGREGVGMPGKGKERGGEGRKKEGKREGR